MLMLQFSQRKCSYDEMNFGELSGGYIYLPRLANENFSKIEQRSKFHSVWQGDTELRYYLLLTTPVN